MEDVARESAYMSHVVDFFLFQAEDGIRYLTVTGVQTCALPICDGAAIRLPPGQIPAAHPPVERVRRGPEPPIGATRPVGGVMARAAPVATRVRDLVELIAASRKAHVGKQVLLGVALVVRHRGGAARDPAGEGSPLLDAEPRPS